MGEPGCRWIGRAANPGIQMGKTPLCTDAAEPVAGGATADKYVSRQHHGSVAHRAEARSLRYPGRAAPRCPRHTTSCTARRTSQFLFGTRCLSSLSLSLSLSSASRREARSLPRFQSLFVSSFLSSSFSFFLSPFPRLPPLDGSLFLGRRCLYLSIAALPEDRSRAFISCIWILWKCRRSLLVDARNRIAVPPPSDR